GESRWHLRNFWRFPAAQSIPELRGLVWLLPSIGFLSLFRLGVVFLQLLRLETATQQVNFVICRSNRQLEPGLTRLEQFYLTLNSAALVFLPAPSSFTCFFGSSGSVSCSGTLNVFRFNGVFDLIEPRLQ